MTFSCQCTCIPELKFLEAINFAFVDKFATLPTMVQVCNFYYMFDDLAISYHMTVTNRAITLILK